TGNADQADLHPSPTRPSTDLTLVRIATYYIWARLHRDGERGLAEGLALLAGLVERFGAQLLPSRPASRKMALEWLAGEKMLDSLARYPEAAKEDFANIVGVGGGGWGG
ncbi:type VI secretion system ImpA family N-terminal domain-containing protein, partial [Escherichia coli]|uniref:type VI secretion system ImpA family N-terminal domain-containing protein n=1 Tax=Escherichia coli TaxID=562 RepID=UPI002117644B